MKSVPLLRKALNDAIDHTRGGLLSLSGGRIDAVETVRRQAGEVADRARTLLWNAEVIEIECGNVESGIAQDEHPPSLSI